ncbi:hypothetical protein HDU91_002658 [Kappamyces sp. JEL0680]|nr:hypothetical protein HDU91_002658 [Kappamyces sp. JEL0680]
MGMVSAGKSEVKKGLPKSQGLRRCLTPALQFHVHLQEVFDSYPESPSGERIKICFEILESLKSQVGTYSTVLTIITDELKKAVYSSKKTATAAEPFYENIPFCQLVDRMQTVRTKETEAKEQQIADLKQKLRFKEEDLDLVYRKNLLLKQQLSEMEKSQMGLQDQLGRFEAEMESHVSEKSQIRLEMTTMEEKYQKQLDDLQAAHHQAAMALEMLTVLQAPSHETQEGRALSRLSASCEKTACQPGQAHRCGVVQPSTPSG